MPDRFAAGRIKLPGHAPSIGAKFWLAPGELNAGVVPIGHAPVCVGRVDGDGELIELRNASVCAEEAGITPDELQAIADWTNGLAR